MFQPKSHYAKTAQHERQPLLLHQSHCKTRSYPSTPKSKLSASPTVRVLPEDGWCSVCDGLSPNTFRYSTENRPSSTKPKQVAISVTVTSPRSADKRAPLA